MPWECVPSSWTYGRGGSCSTEVFTEGGREGNFGAEPGRVTKTYRQTEKGTRQHAVIEKGRWPVQWVGWALERIKEIE